MTAGGRLSIPNQRRPAIVAHRGASGTAPENTLVAFRRALEKSPDAIELDVHRTADGHIVVIHDAKVDRTTNGSGLVAQMTLDAIRSLDAGSWKGAEFAGERIPTLAEVCALVRGRTYLFVEIKAEGIADDVLQVLESEGMAGYAIPISFSAANVRRVRELRPDMAVGFISTRAEDCRIAADLGADVFCLQYRAVTEQIVQDLHAQERLISVWTVNDPEEMRRMAALGVDFLTTDYVERA